MAKKICCRWEQDKRLLVNPDGQALPCCYLANVYYQSKIFKQNGNYDKLFAGHKAQMEHEVLKSYMENEDKYNVFKTDVEDIVNGEWFVETLPKSWKSEETVHIQCKRMCEVDE